MNAGCFLFNWLVKCLVGSKYSAQLLCSVYGFGNRTDMHWWTCIILRQLLLKYPMTWLNGMWNYVFWQTLVAWQPFSHLLAVLASLIKQDVLARHECTQMQAFVQTPILQQCTLTPNQDLFNLVSPQPFAKERCQLVAIGRKISCDSAWAFSGYVKLHHLLASCRRKSGQTRAWHWLLEIDACACRRPSWQWCLLLGGSSQFLML